MPDFPIVHDYSSLVDALRAAKEHLQISNETLEALSGLCPGYADKLLGPSQAKRIGPTTLGLLLGALGIRLRVEVDLAAAKKMATRWERRNELQVRPAARLSKELLTRAASELGKRGAVAAAKARRRQARRNGNGHAANGHAR